MTRIGSFISPIVRNPLRIALVPFILLALFALIQIALRIYINVPDSGTLGSGLVDADRLANGMTVYEDPFTGHPAWIYGPSLIVVNGFLFKLTGPSIMLMRLESLLSTIGTIALATALVWRWLTPFWRWLVIGSFVMIDCKVGYFGTIATDATALFLALLGLAVCYRGGVRAMALGSLLIVAGALTKQTVLVFVTVPALVCLMRGRLPKVRELVVAFIPGTLAVLAFVLLFRLWPDMWFYLVKVPSLYPFTARNYAEVLAPFVAGLAPLVFVAAIVGDRLPSVLRSPEHALLAERFRWVGATALVAIPVGVLSLVKPGGGNNSLMPAWYLMLALTWMFVAVDFISAHRIRHAAWRQAALLTSIALTLFPSPVAWVPLNNLRTGIGHDYAAIINTARQLPDRAIAPGDPAIMLFARGQHDRGLYPQLDTLGWPHKIPSSILAQGFSAPYIIETPYMAPNEDDPMDLKKRGYRVIGGNFNYRIWKAPAPSRIDVQ